MNRIEQMIADYIRDVGMAKLAERDGQHGVIFLDENEFIPFSDLGYNHKLGFYRLSQFPDQTNEAAQSAP